MPAAEGIAAARSRSRPSMIKRMTSEGSDYFRDQRIALDQVMSTGAHEKSLPLLWLLTRVGAIFESKVVLVIFYVLALLGAVLFAIFGGAHTTFLFWKNEQELVYASDRVLMYAILRGIIALALSLSTFSSLRKVTRYLNSSSKESGASGPTSPRWVVAASAPPAPKRSMSDVQEEKKPGKTSFDRNAEAGAQTIGLSIDDGASRSSRGKSDGSRDERYTTIKAQQKALIRESWNQFWRHKLHKVQSGFIRKLFIFDAVLGLVFIGEFGFFGIYYHIYNRDVTGLEAGSGEDPSIVHPVTSAVMSMVVWWLYLPFIVAMWLLWLTSFALGAAICDAELIDVTKLVCTITPFEPEWENKVVIKLQKIRWRFFELLNNGWGSALGAQVLIFAAMNLSDADARSERDGRSRQRRPSEGRTGARAAPLLLHLLDLLGAPARLPGVGPRVPHEPVQEASLAPPSPQPAGSRRLCSRGHRLRRRLRRGRP